MRLKQYLTNEAVTWTPDDMEIFAKAIVKNCKPYLKLLKGRNPLVRGMTREQAATYGAGKKTVRKDRISRAGLDPKKTERANEWLDSIGAARRDKSVIAISKPKLQLFGPEHWIFPEGKFKYTYVKSDDFNSSNRSGWEPAKFWVWLKIRAGGDKEKLDKFEKALFTEEFNPKKLFGINKGFDEAYNKGYEIWFECKKYYFIELESPSGSVIPFSKAMHKLIGSMYMR